MSEIGEALGTAVEGGLFARAIDRGSRGSRDTAELVEGHFAEGACLNCGTDLVGPHCHACGQKAHLHRTLGAFLHDLIHGALHLEGRTWKTLPLLIRKRGELTRRYIDGERARFVSPMALFLFAIFLMFAVFQLAGISTPTDVQATSPAEIGERLDAAKAEARDDVEQQRARLDALEPGDAARAEAQARLEELEQTYEAIETTEAFTLGQTVEDGIDQGTGIAFVDAGIQKWRKNPGLMLYKLQTNFYKFSWLLIPLSIPFVWLLFAWKRRFKAYDHAIFVTYSLSFMTLLILALTLLGLAGLDASVLALATIFIPPIHIYKHLRGAYDLSRFSAVWRLGILSVFIIVILTLFLQALLVLGAF
ncbi:DUF3667 domain-containing protein [Qipengyuania sp. XHP0207]|uniref:DUF3667 domain-containing protein n=1 Tax=Qipengyuania sp. XHP0207 TaxID=3038078 RepID=UPI00241C273D|nr:DUF3667 domain-containing protein [Qipengyuania sp. XHP0207]MDG5747779.1 DUF3667 domain-containing protein [Qipengyuania sp. XHP0207]